MSSRGSFVCPLRSTAADWSLGCCHPYTQRHKIFKKLELFVPHQWATWQVSGPLGCGAPHSAPFLFLNDQEDTADEVILELRQMISEAVGKASSHLEKSNKQERERERREQAKLTPVLCMQRASRLLVVTFRQRALVYTRRAHIDWVRVDELKLNAVRRDRVPLLPSPISSFHNACL